MKRGSMTPQEKLPEEARPLEGNTHRKETPLQRRELKPSKKKKPKIVKKIETP
ncbi:hypothetical protein A2U01_0070873, partial [Trifolium medium]|nr:hypothetical protein [Trifolium medium]